MSGSRSSRKKEGFRGFLRHGLDKITGQGHLPQTPGSASHQSLPVSTSVKSSYTHAGQHGPATTTDTIHLSVLSQSAAGGRSVSAPDLSTDTSAPQAPAITQDTSSDIVQNTGNAKTERSSAWIPLEAAMRTLQLTSKGFPLLHSTMDTLISFLELFESASEHREDYDRMASDLEHQIVQLNQHLSSSNSTALSDCVTNVIKSLQIELGLVDERKKQGATMGVLRAKENAEDLVRCFQRVSDTFRRLQIDASLSAWSVANEILANTRLEALMPAKLARYNAILPADIARRTCTERTRTDILSGLDDWSCDPSKPKVYWMNGMAGTGKTTIACSLSEALTKRKQLCASFFCTRTLPECRDAGRIVPTIAYQLARYSRPFQTELCKVLENDPDIRTQQIPVQFEYMLKGPLSVVKDTIPSNVVVVIDALDECDDVAQVTDFLTELFRSALEVPLKFFVTSRPEPGISDGILSKNSQVRDILHLHEIEESLVQADIELYLKEELSSLSPSEYEIKQTAQLAGSLFIYAATAIRYIRPAGFKGSINSRERMRAIIHNASGSTKQHAELDTLYRTILEAALNVDELESHEVERGLATLWTAVSVREPVSVECLASLAGLETTDAQTILQSLQSVLHTSLASGLVSTLHASFPDFIRSQDRSRQFFCDNLHNLFMAEQCFSLMKVELRFNICQLKSPFTLDEAVKDLDERVAAHISQPLLYVCKYWGDHLSLLGSLDGLAALLEDFLSHRLLFWMEVLNLARLGSIWVTLLSHVRKWLIGRGAPPYLARLISDARLFAANFTQNPVANSTPHIYLSALSFCYRSSLVYSLYLERMQRLIHIGGTALERRQGNEAKWSTGVQVKSISVSPVGNLVAFGGCDDQNQGVIGVLDYHTGTYSMPVFKGHNKPITSVAFSPGGDCIVSASEDQAICIWNASSAELSCQPLRGHTDLVSSVAFSPDGVLLVSGSHDTTVRAWNVQNGEAEMNPFEGHTDAVLCVAFSPDGSRVVSGSRDNTIRVWGIEDGCLVSGPSVIARGSYVWSVASPPTGSHVAVGFTNGVSMWDVQACEPVENFFQGYIDRTVSIAFSSDGSRITSSTNQNGTISIWNSHTGKLASELDTHTKSVDCVALSPDGMHILSSSNDSTICVWPTLGLNHVTDRSKGVPSPVNCIAFSADGGHFASGSYNGSVCVWDIHDGGLTVGPLQGHGVGVIAVAYSPDQSHIISVASDGSLFTWSAQNGSVVSGPVQGPVPEAIRSMAISPDVTRVVSGFESGAICVWGVEDGKMAVDLFEGHSGRIYSVAFSPDGTHMVSGSADWTVCVWNAHDGARTAGPFTAHIDWVRSVSFSPDGSRIASGSDDRTICVHNADNGKVIAGPVSGHSDLVMFVAFSPDGTHIVSGSDDGEVRVWNAHSGKQVAGPFTGASITCVAFSLDGRHIICCRYDRSIRFIPISPSPPGALVSAPDGGLEVDESGWLADQQGQHLLWVPPHIRPFFPSLYESLVIGSDGTIQVDYRGILVGEEWAKCYVG